MGRKLKIILVVLLFSSLAVAQRRASLKRVADETIDAISGQKLYASYCSVCHAADAEGGGAFSPQLKAWPPDLTQIAQKNSGTFPRLHVSEVIDGEFPTATHGSSEMPVWGPIFRSVAQGRHDSAQLRINNLVKYLESIQQK